MDRVIHVITSECEVYVSNEGDMTRVKITEKNPNLVNPTSFEIEGDPKHIAEALATAAAVCQHIEEQSRKDPN
jgi:hypothetical protein